ncbi:MAG: DNA topoisomerase IV subunit A [Erysipelotrichaceae bacterium]|nr:DNA topoisomerase IV subunit A [Erysipelotrichaceae bacterium]MDY5252497.1 DNA topoisomerase IV subunit A [Erysipelotrichaceae bacterium]
MVKNKEIQESTLINTPLENIMSDRFSRYSKYIIQERALPDARDGLKPVQRRILYAMFHEGNTFDHAFRKSAKTVGIVIGNYHPHGDSSVYEAMVRMSQDWKINHPLIEMHGNNGSIDDDPAAAMRYTEARLSKIASTMEVDLDKDTVEFAPNFDDTEVEPTVLPARFPTLLVNGSTGIAAGYATNIAPHNLTEVINATIYRIQNPECSLEEIMEIMPGPDFPTGAIVQGKKGILDAFKTGKGRVVVRSKAQIIQTKTIQQIVITEIPYEVVKINMVKKMDEIKMAKDIDGIIDVRDESDRNGLKIVVDIKKDVNAQQILNYFYKNTDLQVYYNYNMIAIIDKTPKQVGVIDLIDCFIRHREDVVIKRSRYELNKMENRCHVLEGLMKAVSIMDEIIAIIRQSKDKQDSKLNLIKRFGFSEAQAEAIVTMRLYRLSNTDIKQLREEFAYLINKIEETKAILANKKVLDRVIINELKEISKEYGQARKTQIIDEIEEIVIDKTSMIANERVMITISKDGYVKKVSLRSFNSTDSITGRKEGDSILGIKEVDTLDTLLLFTSKGNYAYLPVYQIDEAKWKDLGMHINKYIKIDAQEKIVSAIVIKNFVTYAWIITVSAKGYIKKTPVEQFNLTRNNKVVCGMKIKKDDELVKAFIGYAHQDVIVVSRDGFATRYNIDGIPSTNTKSLGVKAINLAKQDVLASACCVDQAQIVLVGDNAQMKRIKQDNIHETSRYVKGERLCKYVKSNPVRIMEIRSVDLYDKLNFVKDSIEKIEVKDISLMSLDSTFANPLSLESGWYLEKEIAECRIIDKPADDTLMIDHSQDVEENNLGEYEMLNLFGDDK